MAEQTVLDALIAELLGDVGKLHDAVKDLRGALPALTEETRVHLESAARSASAEATRLETAAKNTLQQVSDAAKRAAAQSFAETRQQEEAELRKAIASAVAEEVHRIAEAVSTQLARLEPTVIAAVKPSTVMLNDSATRFAEAARVATKEVQAIASKSSGGFFGGVMTFVIAAIGGMVGASAVAFFLLL